MQKRARFLDFIKSLKFRFIILITVMIVVPGIVLCLGILNSYEARAVSIRESEVLSQAKILANQIATSEYLSNAGTESTELKAKVDMLTAIYDGRVLVVDDNFRIITDTYNLDDNKVIISKEVVKSFSGQETVNYDSENHYIELSIPIIDPEDEKGTVNGVINFFETIIKEWKRFRDWEGDELRILNPVNKSEQKRLLKKHCGNIRFLL